MLLDVKHKPKDYQKLFFGDYGNFQRLDKTNASIFQKLAENSEANTWFINEIDCTKDRKGWERLPDVAKRMFHLNILYQNAMDSLVPNTFGLLSDLASDTWLSYLYNRISVEESIHSNSYSSGLIQAFGSKATEMLDYIYDDEMLQKRTDREIEDAERFIEVVFKQGKTDDEAKKSLLTLLIRTYFLEGVKFPFSFFTTWTINKAYGNAIQGFSQLLKLIAFDELTVHTATGQNVLNILMTDKSQGFLHLKDWYETEVVRIAHETAELELEWNAYLLKDGSIPGFTQAVGEHFIKYWVDYRLRRLKLPAYYNEESSDVVEWFNSYRDLNNTQIALQEADNTNYQKGNLMNDLNRFDGLKETK